MTTVSTSDQYDVTKWTVRGIITATHTEAISVGRGFVADIGGIFGGQSDTMNKKLEDVLRQVRAKLEQQVGPGESLVGVKFNFTEFGRSQTATFLSAVASGTLLSPKQGGGGLLRSLRSSRRGQTRRNSRR